MATFIIRRLLWLVVVLFAISILVFLIFFATPGVDPARQMAGRNPTAATIKNIKHEFGLDRPLPVRYGLMMKHIFISRDLISYGSHTKVIPEILAAAPVTFSLILGAAGLLKGYRATTHWMSHDQLTYFGATPVAERVVVDRNRITGGGVTAGIDFGLSVARVLADEQTARAIQLGLEYDPQPPFNSGSVGSATFETVTMVRERAAAMLAERLDATKRAAERLGDKIM